MADPEDCGALQSGRHKPTAASMSTDFRRRIGVVA
jgi:hypothetical protein